MLDTGCPMERQSRVKSISEPRSELSSSLRMSSNSFSLNLGTECNYSDIVVLISSQPRLAHLIIGTWPAPTSPWTLAFCSLHEGIICIILFGEGLVDGKVNETKDKITIFWGNQDFLISFVSFSFSLPHGGEIYMFITHQISYW